MKTQNFKDDEQNRFNFTKIVTIKSEYPQIVVEQLLYAMKLNSYEARQRFPRLLQMVEMYSQQTIDNFINSTFDIPCWMFLGWLSQMTALLDKPKSKAIEYITLSIANEYPQAFIYPFKLSLESFKFDYQNFEQKEFVEKLKSKTNKIPYAKQFIASLEQLSNPNSIFRDFYEEINKNLKNRENLIKLFKDLYTNLIEYNPSDDSSLDGVEWGIIKKNFSKFIKPLFESEFGENGKLLACLGDSEISTKMKVLIKEVAQYSLKEGNLGDYSPWLKNFKRNLAKDLEIPGK